MNGSRFNLYDFFAYITPGYVALVGLFVLFVPRPCLESAVQEAEPYKYVLSAASLLAAYGLGHLLSELASIVEERLLVAKWLRYPSENLFATTPRNVVLFRQYRRPYDGAFAADWTKTYEAAFGRRFEHRTAFLDAFHTVKEISAPTRQRLEMFIATYGFCRNLAMTLGILIPGIIVRAVVTRDLSMVVIAIVLALIMFVFFTRYLKFFRHFADEVFRTFYVIQKRKP